VPLRQPDVAIPKCRHRVRAGLSGECRRVIDFHQETIDDQPDAVLASVARIGAITRDVLRCAAATGATPLSVADGIVRARIIRRA
jgi:hypothetical protein